MSYYWWTDVYAPKVDLYIAVKLAKIPFGKYSHSEFTRKLKEGAIKINDKVIKKNITFIPGTHKIRYGRWVVIFLEVTNGKR